MIREPPYVGCYFFQQPVRRNYFDGLGFPSHFYGPEEYSRWLIEAGLNPQDLADLLEFILKF